MNSGRLSLATRYFERALARAEDEPMRVRIQASMAFIAMDRTDFAAALAVLERALGLPDLPLDVRGILLGQRAAVLARSGRVAESMESYGAAIDALGDRPWDLAKALMNRGNAHLSRRAPVAATADFERAIELYRLAGDPDGAARSEHNVGYALFQRGDLAGALHRMEQAFENLVAGPLTAAVCREDRAEVLLVAGLRHEGADLLQDAAHDYGRLRMRQRQASSELTLATHLRAYDPARARKIAMQARRRFAGIGAQSWWARADAAVLAAEVDLGGASRSLLERADSLFEELTSQGLDWGAASIRLHAARVLARRGDFGGARRRLAQVRLNDDAPLTIRLLARDARSELESAQGRRKPALMQIRQGLEELHSWQSSFGSLDLQTMVVGHGVRLAMRALGLAVESGEPALLFEWSERARMLASRVQPVRAPAHVQLADDLAELRASQHAIDGPRVPQPRRDRDEELRRRIRERAWQLRGSGAVTTPCALDELQSGIGAAHALVAWVVTPDRVTALVVTSSSAEVVDLGPRAPLDELLQGLLPDLDVAASSELPEVLARSIRTQLGYRLSDLAGLLVTRLLPLLGDRAVVLTPSGVLAGVPWTLLDGLVGRPVTVARSATTWLASTPLSVATAGFVAGPRVARAEEEIKAAASVWQSPSVLVGPDASTTAVSALAGEVDVLHLAAHGRHSGDNPLFSGLEFVDGVWFGYDIDALERVPQVVLLSACEVGRSSVRYGEELIGMTAAWLYAGARCVIASPAAVSDEVAHDVFVAVHSGLAAGLSPAEALAAAVPAASADAPPAPFSCFM